MMARAMSFFLTTQQMYNQTKTVTRRNGWKNLKVGERLWAVVKCMGLKKGEKHQRIALIETISVRREPLNTITPQECVLEGFPNLSPTQFIKMYCDANKCQTTQEITRIEFGFVPHPKGAA